MSQTSYADVVGTDTSSAPNFIVIPVFEKKYGENNLKRFSNKQLEKFKKNPKMINQNLFNEGFGKEIRNFDLHLFMVDYDSKNDPSLEKRLSNNFYLDFEKKLEGKCLEKFGEKLDFKENWDKIVFEKSKSGGLHFYFTCQELSNKDFPIHLAKGKIKNEEGIEQVKAFIELLNRLSTVPIHTQKSPFECKRPSEYEKMEVCNNKTIDHISELPKPFVETIFEVLQSYNEYVEAKKVAEPQQKKVISTQRNEFSDSLTPWHDYNSRESSIEKFCELMGFVYKKDLFYLNSEEMKKGNHCGQWSASKKKAFFRDSKKNNEGYGGDSGLTIFDTFRLANGNISKNEASQMLFKQGYGIMKETTENAVKPAPPPPQQKIIEVKKTNTFFKIGTLNEKMEQIKNEPRRLKILDSMWYSRGLCFLYGDNGMGKSYLAFQIAVGIARGEKEICGLTNELDAQKVLYFDFEQTPYDYRERYTDYKYPENLIHFNPELNQETINASEMTIFEEMRGILVEQKASIIIIDNITALSNGDLTRGDIAKKVMNGLLLLKNTGASILILAHTPKLSAGLDDRPRPITKNQLAGSKKISDLADSMFAIGEVPNDKFKKYIIQTKGRGGEVHSKENVLLIQQAKVFDGLQGFEKVQVTTEKSLLLSDYEKADLLEKANFKNSIDDLVKQGATQAEIAQKLGVSQGKISKALRK
jgi:archaellum biogenesis ATPase FlaH